jgi:hypothetical protein
MLKIEKETAKKIYDSVPEFFKEQLESEFGKETFRKRVFTDIKTFGDACEALGIDPASVVSTNDAADEAAYKKLKVVIKAINQNWIPDWSNTSQRKWWPWFVLSSGFGFSGSDCNCADSNAYVGSRLCFESEEKSDYCAKQFIDLWEAFIK